MVRDEILARRKGAKPLLRQLQEGRRRLGPAPPLKRKESPRSPLESAVLRRRAAIDPQDNSHSADEQEFLRKGFANEFANPVIQHFVSLD